MLPRSAILSDPVQSLEQRRTRRRSIALGFDAIEHQAGTRVLILDLSRTGMRIQTSARFDIGESFELVIPEAGTVAATIVRESSTGLGREFGAEFDEPITEAAVSAVILASPADAPPVEAARQDQWITEAEGDFVEGEPVSSFLLVTMFLLGTAIIGSFVYAMGFLPVSG